MKTAGARETRSNDAGLRLGSRCGRLAAGLLAIVAASGGTASAAAGPYACPAGPAAPAVQLCDSGSVIALIGHAGNKEKLLAYMRKFIPSARGIAREANLPGPQQGLLSEVRDVHALRSFPNMFVFRFRSGLATKDRVDLLRRQICNVLNMQQAREYGLEPCRKSAVDVRLEASLKVHSYAGAPDDPAYESATWPDQWGLKEVAGIKALAAWKRAGTVTVLKPVTVATMDTGVAVVGDELEPSLLIDGADFTVSPPVLGNPGDVDGHGTAVASVIAARTNNSAAIAGVAWSGRDQGRAAALMPVRIMTAATDSPDSPEQCTHNLLDALPYVVDPDDTVDAGNPGQGTFWDLTHGPDPNTPPFRPAKGARIVNLSAGFSACSTDVGETLRRIEKFFPDVLFVVAVPDAGKGAPGKNIDGDPSKGIAPAPDYPTSYPFSNILTVTATGDDGCVTEKYGKTSVDMAAPGFSIMVLNRDGTDLPTRSGTSFAAPHVSGAAALLKSLAPADWQFAQVKQYLLDSSDQSMCEDPVKEAQRCQGVIAGWPSICDGVASGLLDLDASTAPPVAKIVPVKNGTQAHTWNTDRPATVTWTRSFASELCKDVDADLIVDQADASNSTKTVRLSSSPLKVNAKSAAFDASVMARVGSDGIPGTASSATARIRLQCLNSTLFRMSADFTVKRVN